MRELDLTDGVSHHTTDLDKCMLSRIGESLFQTDGADLQAPAMRV